MIQLQSPSGLPVLPSVPFACMPSPLPRQVGGSCSLILFPLIGLPQVRGGSAPASWISRLAQRSLTLRPTRLQSRFDDPLPSEAPAASLPPPLLRLLPGGTNQFPGGTCTHFGLNAFHGARGSIPVISRLSRRRAFTWKHRSAASMSFDLTVFSWEAEYRHRYERLVSPGQKSPLSGPSQVPE